MMTLLCTSHIVGNLLTLVVSMISWAWLFTIASDTEKRASISPALSARTAA